MCFTFWTGTAQKTNILIWERYFNLCRRQLSLMLCSYNFFLIKKFVTESESNLELWMHRRMITVVSWVREWERYLASLSTEGHVDEKGTDCGQHDAAPDRTKTCWYNARTHKHAITCLITKRLWIVMIMYTGYKEEKKKIINKNLEKFPRDKQCHRDSCQRRLHVSAERPLRWVRIPHHYSLHASAIWAQTHHKVYAN